MTWAKTLALFGLVAMSIMLVYGFAVGDFLGEGAWLLAHPWGQVTLVDVYVGFALFCGWVVYREHSLARSLVWILVIMVLGNWATSFYALLALYSSNGDWKHFWLGKQAS